MIVNRIQARLITSDVKNFDIMMNTDLLHESFSYKNENSNDFIYWRIFDYIQINEILNPSIPEKYLKNYKLFLMLRAFSYGNYVLLNGKVQDTFDTDIADQYEINYLVELKINDIWVINNSSNNERKLKILFCDDNNFYGAINDKYSIHQNPFKINSNNLHERIFKIERDFIGKYVFIGKHVDVIDNCKYYLTFKENV